MSLLQLLFLSHLNLSVKLHRVFFHPMILWVPMWKKKHSFVFLFFVFFLFQTMNLRPDTKAPDFTPLPPLPPTYTLPLSNMRLPMQMDDITHTPSLPRSLWQAGFQMTRELQPTTLKCGSY